MANVKIYGTQQCPYCRNAKQFFEDKGIAYEELDLTGDADALAALVERTNHRTVPQIFVGETFIGGYDDLVKADQAGKLTELLG